MTHHVVFGAGLIGCFLGAALQQKCNTVTLLGRASTLDKLRSGLRLTDYQQHQVQANNLTSCSDVSQIQQPVDVIWLTVKCGDVVSACEQMSSLVSSKTVIICCQNGLGSQQAVKQHFYQQRVLRAVVPFNVVEISEGHLHRGSEGKLTIEQHEEFTSNLVAQFDQPIMPLAEHSDMEALQWAKLQLNIGNSVNALADVPVKTMLQQRPYRLVIAAMMTELLLVTKRKGIRLPKVTAVPAQFIPWVLRLPNWLFVKVANSMLAIDPEVRTSMWWDIRNNKTTEINFLNGAVVKAGKMIGIECPVNAKVIELIEQLSASNNKNEQIKLTANEFYIKVVNQ